MHDHDTDLSATATELCAGRLLGLIEEFRDAATEDAACTAFLAAVEGSIDSAVADAMPAR